MKVALINDTSLFSNHFGCQLVGQVYREQFKRTGLDLTISLPKIFNIEDYKSKLDEVDLVVVNGEGSIHHGRNPHLLEVSKKYPSVLLNCVYQENPRNDALKEFLHISARESYSALEIQQKNIKCSVVPDVIFASSFVRSFPKPNSTKDLGITDNVRKEYHYKYGPFKKKVKGDFSAHGHSPAEYIYQLTQYNRICAGRFHAAVISALLEIPFATWDSNTWKTEAMLKDMGIPEHHFKSRELAVKNTPLTFDPKIKEFTDNAKIQIEKNFNKVAELAKALAK
ncbi:polysaccharide pyruvyl transferase family protein [Litoribrevibacter euphylliae]|uniref:Polysaccharide pyruvyl transferase family protein n=1 Tax=Litoribrevibacter euphylliae TaxID=1834034 RepID=A0ABV7HNN7_9GAMM